MLLDINQLKKTIREGVQNGQWIYYPASEGIGYGEPSPTPMIEIGEDATLYTLDEAQRVGIKIKAPNRNPKSARCAARCRVSVTKTTRATRKVSPFRVSSEGTPAQAFQTIADQCHDQGVKALVRMFIRVEGMGKDAARDIRSLGLAIPQMGKAQYQVDQRLVLEFDAARSSK